MQFKTKLVVVVPTLGGSNWSKRIDEAKGALKENMPSASLSPSLLLRTIGHTLGYFIGKTMARRFEWCFSFWKQRSPDECRPFLFYHRLSLRWTGR